MPRTKFLSIATVLLVGTLMQRQSEAASPPIKDELIPHKVAVRLLCHCDSNQDTRILVGRLPEQLPVELPMPNNAKVVASVVQSPTNVEIVLDAPQSNAQVQSFYKEKLKAAGWKSQENTTFEALMRGFIPTENIQDQSLEFCKAAKGPRLMVDVRSVENAPTDVHLRLNADPKDNLCENSAQAEMESYKESLEAFESSRGPLPKLTAPSNATVSNTQTNGVDVTRATIGGKLSLKSLADHYESQFSRDGWTRLDSKQIDNTLSSIWYLKDKSGRSWQGILNLTNVEGTPNQFSGSVTVLPL